MATVISATLSCDHRIIDGAVGARFLQVLGEVIAGPALRAGHGGAAEDELAWPGSCPAMSTPYTGATPAPGPPPGARMPAGTSWVPGEAARPTSSRSGNG